MYLLKVYFLNEYYNLHDVPINYHIFMLHISLSTGFVYEFGGGAWQGNQSFVKVNHLCNFFFFCSQMLEATNSNVKNAWQNLVKIWQTSLLYM